MITLDEILARWQYDHQTIQQRIETLRYSLQNEPYRKTNSQRRQLLDIIKEYYNDPSCGSGRKQ